jgi:hypothetical protein
VRLHVGVLGPEQRLGPVDGQLLDLSTTWQPP